MKNFPLTVIDNFFDYPEAVVEFAESVEYSPPKESTYPGVISSQEVIESNPSLVNWAMSKVINLFYDLDRTYIAWNAESSFQKITPYNNDDQYHILNRGIPHIDIPGCVAAGVVYLNKNPSKDTGTSLYQKALGSEFYQVPHELVDGSMKHHSGHTVDNYEKIVQDHFDNFEETARIQAKFNRLVFYSADSWHSQTTYGKKDDEDRLTFRFFISLQAQDRDMPLRRQYD